MTAALAGVRGARVERLFRSDHPPAGREIRGGRLPEPLADRYGDGELAVVLRADRPTVIANFVSTLDGIVALAADGSSGGGEVSGFFEPDRFVMGLLRGLADAVLVGAGTVRAAPGHRWVPDHVQPALADELAAWRHELGLAPRPTTIVVTASGELSPEHPGLADPAIPVTVVTTPAGAALLARHRFGSHVRVHVAADTARVQPRDLLDAAVASGARLVLCEGGPHLFGDLLGARLIDELFLTLSPQLAGRDRTAPRLALIEGTAFPAAAGRWADLASVHRSGQHLFLRYALQNEETSR